MTRKDYVLLAQVCSRFKLPHRFLLVLAHELKHHNKAFDIDRFMNDASFKEEL